MIICYFGDSITLGYGDPSGLGWPGRVSGTLNTLGVDVTSYNLGVRKDASTLIQHRWQAEAELRILEGMDLKLVFSMGVADVIHQKAPEETLEAAETILNHAKTLGEVLLVGPTPVDNKARTDTIKELSTKLAELCETHDVPYVPVVEAMQESGIYQQALKDGDSVHPSAIGYAALAEYILQSEPARAFFGLE